MPGECLHVDLGTRVVAWRQRAQTCACKAAQRDCRSDVADDAPPQFHNSIIRDSSTFAHWSRGSVVGSWGDAGVGGGGDRYARPVNF